MGADDLAQQGQRQVGGAPQLAVTGTAAAIAAGPVRCGRSTPASRRAGSSGNPITNPSRRSRRHPTQVPVRAAEIKKAAVVATDREPDKGKHGFGRRRLRLS